MQATGTWLSIGISCSDGKKGNTLLCNSLVYKEGVSVTQGWPHISGYSSRFQKSKSLSRRDIKWSNAHEQLYSEGKGGVCISVPSRALYHMQKTKYSSQEPLHVEVKNSVNKLRTKLSGVHFPAGFRWTQTVWNSAWNLAVGGGWQVFVKSKSLHLDRHLRRNIPPSMTVGRRSPCRLSEVFFKIQLFKEKSKCSRLSSCVIKGMKCSSLVSTFFFKFTFAIII